MAYVANGAIVTAVEKCDTNAERLREDSGRAVQVIHGDATDAEVLRLAVERASDGVGLDNLTCCVGVFDCYAGLRLLSASELTTAGNEIYRVNVLSTLEAIRRALPQLERRRGSVTLTLSESAFHPVGGGVLYGSSKWALRGVVAHLASDLAPAIRVNGVAPGGTSGTRFGGLEALGQTQTADQVADRDARIAAGTLLGVAATPEDHAGSYVHLADRAASSVITGTVINTDAGRRY
jgi:NAD(P)-dependent dehydrogenase (short-subunit alcohol dehydrogenase family)